MSGDFLDTNIFVYQFDIADERKRGIADRIIANGVDRSTAVVSFQVVQEALNTMTRKFPGPMFAEEAERFLAQVLIPLWRVNPSPALYLDAIRIQERYGYHFYDSLIIAAAREAGCTRLLTKDMHDGQQIEGLTIVNPFRV